MQAHSIDKYSRLLFNQYALSPKTSWIKLLRRIHISNYCYFSYLFTKWPDIVLTLGYKTNWWMHQNWNAIKIVQEVVTHLWKAVLQAFMKEIEALCSLFSKYLNAFWVDSFDYWSCIQARLMLPQSMRSLSVCMQVSAKSSMKDWQHMKSKLQSTKVIPWWWVSPMIHSFCKHLIIVQRLFMIAI